MFILVSLTVICSAIVAWQLYQRQPIPSSHPVDASGTKTEEANSSAMGIRALREVGSALHANDHAKDSNTSDSFVDRHDVWKGIPMPKKSYFAGFNAPDDQNKWNHARLQAARGEHILLRQVLQIIKSADDLFGMENSFKWTQHLADAHYTAKGGFLKGLDDLKVKDIPLGNASTATTSTNRQRAIPSRSHSNRAPIVLLGNRVYERPNFDGFSVGWDSLGMNDILKQKIDAGGKTPKLKLFTRKVVAMGLFDENWGWLSSYFLNRTITWGMSFGKYASANPLTTPGFQNANLLADEILNDENLIMLVVNSHHNFTHEKVISVPLGMKQVTVKDLWKTMKKAEKFAHRKNPDMLLNTQGSNWAFRPAIRACVAKNMKEEWGDEAVDPSKGPAHSQKRKRERAHSNKAPHWESRSSGFERKVSVGQYRENMVSSYASLCLPGLGADTYKLWESFALGAMPVVERGFGLDRTLYRLPALLVDDFAVITPFMIRQAYIEALYRADQWEYKRMTKQYWVDLIQDVSISGSLKPLLHAHPMSAVDLDFTRPMIPFECPGGRHQGCGPGTKRTPLKSCAVDRKVLELGSKYNLFYPHVVLEDPDDPDRKH